MSEKEIYDRNLVDNQQEMALVYKDNRIDVGEIEKENINKSLSARRVTIGKDCIWAITKSLGKIGLLAAGGYAIGKLSIIADVLGSLKEAAYLITLSIKDGNLTSYLKSVGISNSSKINTIVSIAGEIAESVTGVGEVMKNCWNYINKNIMKI